MGLNIFWKYFPLYPMLSVRLLVVLTGLDIWTCTCAYAWKKPELWLLIADSFAIAVYYIMDHYGVGYHRAFDT
jgi:hypothetical protein